MQIAMAGSNSTMWEEAAGHERNLGQNSIQLTASYIYAKGQDGALTFGNIRSLRKQ